MGKVFNRIINFPPVLIQMAMEKLPLNSKMISYAFIIFLEILILPVFLIVMTIFIILAMLTLFIALLVTLVMSPVAIFIEAKKQVEEFNKLKHEEKLAREIASKCIGYKTHEIVAYDIKDEDTLESISDKFNCPIDILKEIFSMYKRNKYIEFIDDSINIEEIELSNDTLHLCKYIFVMKKTAKEEK